MSKVVVVPPQLNCQLLDAAIESAWNRLNGHLHFKSLLLPQILGEFFAVAQLGESENSVYSDVVSTRAPSFVQILKRLAILVSSLRLSRFNPM